MQARHAQHVPPSRGMFVVTQQVINKVSHIYIVLFNSDQSILIEVAI